MKKIFLICVLLIATTLTLQAQTITYGIKGGLNFANQKGSDIIINNTNYKTSTITAFHIGLLAKIDIFNGLALQPELLYTTKGANYKDAVNEFINELGYLSIPVMLKINLNKSLSLELGPQASFLLSQRNEFDVKDAKTFDFGVAAGLGLKITKNLFIEGRYGLGLTNVSKDADIKNSVIQLSAGILF